MEKINVLNSYTHTDKQWYAHARLHTQTNVC